MKGLEMAQARAREERTPSPLMSATASSRHAASLDVWLSTRRNVAGRADNRDHDVALNHRRRTQPSSELRCFGSWHRPDFAERETHAFGGGLRYAGARARWIIAARVSATLREAWFSHRTITNSA